MRWTQAASALSLAFVLGTGLLPAHAQSADATTQARALFDEYWEWLLREIPDAATLYFGEHRYDDRLRDESPAAVIRRSAGYLAFLQRAAAIDAARLSPHDRVSLRILRERLDAGAAIIRASGSLPFNPIDDWAPITQMSGFHLDLPQLGLAANFNSTADYEAWLKRLDAVPISISNLIERMQRAIDAGWMPPKVAVSRVPSQLDVQLVANPRDNPEFQPFKRFPRDMAPAEQTRLAQAGERAIRDKVIPAFRSLKAFYDTRYLPAASQRLGASALPGGMPYYQAVLSWNTTTDMTPRQIHDLGLSEVARIGAQMNAIVTTTGFKGNRAEFQKFISTDPQFFYTRAEDMLGGFRDIAKRADAALPGMFAELPRQTYGIRSMPPEEGNNADRYLPGAADGSRPGWFEANTNDLKTRPKWSMETLLLHEAVPGHHLQVARAKELKQLPAFRRSAWFTAFGEGWALYAESLGDEMGFYKDPYQKYGNLSFEMMRASRLVVDTGLHAFGWTREQAIDYMVDNTGLTREAMTAEVDRYLVWPGQASAYKVGELKIKALRAKARTALGDKFDLRRFHNAVIDNGTVPLAVLEQLIDEWIAAERTKANASESVPGKSAGMR
jgi:uncharacterized protein (DUF885 family)